MDNYYGESLPKLNVRSYYTGIKWGLDGYTLGYGNVRSFYFLSDWYWSYRDFKDWNFCVALSHSDDSDTVIDYYMLDEVDEVDA